ncbi:MAG: N-formylglutamate amidohydrolase [Tatlockia sp.]|nr:N-formylglutamate amidohydrolase [Tatlockia sp.]
MKKIALILSCEHAVNTVPKAYKKLFATHHNLLQTHRGIDIGSLEMARIFSKVFNCDFVQAQATRLLIDCNRSLSHRLCFSEITSVLSATEKAQLIEDYYLPYRQKIEGLIKQHIQQGKQVLHLSVHSFTPTLNELERNIDLGLLYDPKRASEKKLASSWLRYIKLQDKTLRAYSNKPYLGVSDGFTTALRKQFAEKEYAGIEIETNQKLLEDTKTLNYLSLLLATTLKSLI